jgi:uncharacterized protein (DUF1330 family)
MHGVAPIRDVKREGIPMNHRLALSVAVLAGAVVGGVAVGGLNAQQQQQPGQQIQSQSQQSQTQRPRFFVVTLQELIDAQKYNSDYAPKVTKTILDHQGRFIARTDQINQLQGSDPAPKRVVILGFDSMDQIQKWQNSADYKDLAPQRNQVMKLHNQFVIATCPQQGQQPQPNQQACPN